MAAQQNDRRMDVLRALVVIDVNHIEEGVGEEVIQAEVNHIEDGVGEEVIQAEGVVAVEDVAAAVADEVDGDGDSGDEGVSTDGHSDRDAVAYRAVVEYSPADSTSDVYHRTFYLAEDQPYDSNIPDSTSNIYRRARVSTEDEPDDASDCSTIILDEMDCENLPDQSYWWNPRKFSENENEMVVAQIEDEGDRA